MFDATSDGEGSIAHLPVPVRDRAPALDRSGALIAREQRDLLCALAYVSLGVGEADQAITLLDLVLREIPTDTGVIRLAAYARVAAGDGEGALDALDRLRTLESGEMPAPLLLLRSQALRLAGRLDEGRATFRSFVEARRAEETFA